MIINVHRFHVKYRLLLSGLNCHHRHHHHHHVPVVQLDHLLTRFGLTYPEVSSKVYHDTRKRYVVKHNLITDVYLMTM